MNAAVLNCQVILDTCSPPPEADFPTCAKNAQVQCFERFSKSTQKQLVKLTGGVFRSE
jgi:hypothetical protein